MIDDTNITNVDETQSNPTPPNPNSGKLKLCKKCQNTMDAKLKVCPNCGAKCSNTKLKVAGGVAAGLFIIGIAAPNSDKDKDEKSSVDKSNIAITTIAETSAEMVTTADITTAI